MSLGQCVVQWEGAFGVLDSGGGIQCTVQCVWEQSMRCSVYMGAIQCTVQWGGGVQCDVDWFDLVQPTSSHSYCGVLSAMALSCSEDTTCIYFKHLGYISQQKTSMNVLKIC